MWEGFADRRPFLVTPCLSRPPLRFLECSPPCLCFPPRLSLSVLLYLVPCRSLPSCPPLHLLILSFPCHSLPCFPHPLRRARYLLDGAKFLVEQLGGLFPENATDMLKVPGGFGCSYLSAKQPLFGRSGG